MFPSSMPPDGGVLSITTRAIYPTFPGDTIAQDATATNQAGVRGMQRPTASNSEENAPVNTGMTKAAWIATLATLLGVMFIANRFGKNDDFANLRLTFYNIVVITLCALTGFTLLKFVFVRWNVPGFSDIVKAA